MAHVAWKQPERCEETCHFLGVGTSTQTRHDSYFTQIPIGRRIATLLPHICKRTRARVPGSFSLYLSVG